MSLATRSTLQETRPEPRVLLAPRTMRRSWPEAIDSAWTTLEPVFVPCDPHCDDRGWSLMNLLAGALPAQGQINFSLQYPGVVKAWHRHRRQCDFWVCVTGQLKAGIYRESDGQMWAQVMGQQRQGVLIIPPTLWHGAATLGPESAGLLYCVTRAYDPVSPDEDRRPPDSVSGFSWGTEHR